MRKLFGIIVFSLFSAIAFASFAGPPASAIVPTYSSSDETVFSFGLRFELGDTVKPSIVGSVRSTVTDTSNDVTGVISEVELPIGTNSDRKPTVKVLGVFGDTEIQGAAGVGFDFSKNLPLFSLGARGGNVEGGVNITAQGVTGFAGVTSDDGPTKRKKTTSEICILCGG